MGEKTFGLFQNDAAQSAIGTTIGSTSRIGGWGDTNNLGAIGVTFGYVSRGLNLGVYRFATGATGLSPYLEWVNSGGQVFKDWVTNYGKNTDSAINTKGQFNVNDYASLQMALADTQTAQNEKLIYLTKDITISGDLGAQVVTGKVSVYGASLIFSAATSKISFGASASIDFFNDVYINASCTPFGTNAPTLMRFRNLKTSGTFTCTLPTTGTKYYERAQSGLTIANGVQSFWDNTYNAPVATNTISQIESFNKLQGSGITMPGSWKMYGMCDFMPAGGTFSKMAVISPTGLGGSGTGIRAVIGKVTSRASGSFTGTILQISPLYNTNSSGRVDLSFGAPLTLLQSDEYFLALLVDKASSGDLLAIVPSSGVSGGSYISAGENSSGTAPVIGNTVQFFSGTLTMLPWMRAFS